MRQSILVRLITCSTAFGFLCASPPAHAKGVDDGAKAEKVISCFKDGVRGDKKFTIRQMQACSGYWVTPRALTQCALGARCSVFDDTLEGRTTFRATLQALNLSDAAELSLNTDALPLFPSAKQIEECKKGAKDERTFLECVNPSLGGGKYENVRKCFGNSSDEERRDCFLKQAGDQRLTALANCLKKDWKSQAALLNCYPDQGVKQKAASLQKCIESASAGSAATACLSNGLSKEQQSYLNCIAHARAAAETSKCLDNLSPNIAKAQEVVQCLGSGAASVSCTQGMLPPSTAAFSRCLTTARSAEAREDCVASISPEFPRSRRILECVSTPGDKAALAKCLLPFLGEQAGKVADCARAQGAKLESCLAAVNPKIADASKIAGCISTAKNATDSFSCVAPQLGGDAGRIANCFKDPDRTAMALCILGDKPEVRAAQDIYRCVSNGHDTASLIENCTTKILDDRTRQTISCITKSSDDKSKLIACASSSVLPPEVARLASCGANSTGAASFALCAAGPAMNEEWRIASECAAETGGVPVTFAGCAAGRLTFRELTKCFTGQFGKDCFGPNNTIILTVTNAFNDLLHGPGKNNEIVKAIDAIGKLSGGPNSVLNNPGQLAGGPNSMINNPAQIWGGSNSVFNNPSQILGGSNSVFNNPGQLLGGENSDARHPERILPWNWKL